MHAATGKRSETWDTSCKHIPRGRIATVSDWARRASRCTRSVNSALDGLSLQGKNCAYRFDLHFTCDILSHQCSRKDFGTIRLFCALAASAVEAGWLLPAE